MDTRCACVFHDPFKRWHCRVLWPFRLQKDNYEELVHSLVQDAIVLDHNKPPCEENFIPDTQVSITQVCRPFLIHNMPNIASLLNWKFHLWDEEGDYQYDIFLAGQNLCDVYKNGQW